MKAAWLLVLCACAKGGSDVEIDAPVIDVPLPIDSSDPIDAAVHDASPVDGAIADAHVIDAMIDALIPDAFVPDAFVPDAFVPDAFVMPDAAIDAAIPIDAMVDAAVMPDAPMVDAGCTPTTTEVLLNPAFDLSPRGTKWTESSDASLDIITDDTGTPAAQSTPYRAWLGGYEDDGTGATDQLYQNVTIPANTTKLEITGYYAVGTDETGSGDYDDGDLALIKTSGTVVEDILTLSNKSKTTGWVTFDHVFTGNYSGQALRIRMSATNDFSNATSFFFDTLSLKATHCP